ncbi:uncharacterized protein LOC115453604 [Manduca sexta]|uniref:uncharacterized protein LOC115453604 n=1 Tax=Manduca sexta TaxID=7130 RepID=UPI00188FB204|nr:uncharacterized protein LOC115453604 [Manduca sexta]
MLICAELRPLDQDEIAFRRKALRDAVICIGWLKLTSVICYVILYFLVNANSKGNFSNVLQIMTLATIPPQVLHGVLLFLGALEEKILALELSLWFALIMASYNTVLGVMGGIYFIRTGYLTMHFMLAVIFAILAISLFTVLCHDILIIYAYKELLLSCQHPPRNQDMAS